ncbi:MAG: hypothetical protein COB30_005995 [Ectothiorhodospiraceae bacterium]|nr:hypothetical protein [Ectothiorhodospiraceae bacterium]
MATGVSPAVGNWYQGSEQIRFEVTSLDEDDGVIEIQYFDGELDEIEFEAWTRMGIVSISPPEDWSSIYGEQGLDDPGYTDLSARPDSYQYTLDDLERDE